MPRPVAPLVGRTHELADLVAVLDSARQGNAAALVLGGDAGVGKTRLLTAAVEAAQDRGMTVLIGHCVDLGDAPPPYLPFTEAFARLAAEHADSVDRFVAAFPAAARLLPGGGTRDPDDRVDRGDMFEAVVGALSRLATDDPVLLVVEDTHWADQATRDLLGFLFTRLRTDRVAVIVTFRSDDLNRRHPLRQTLAQWARLPAVGRLDLEPLGADDVRALVRGVHPDPIAEADLADIVDRADGNAFFAEELVMACDHLGQAQPLPWVLADLLLVRLERLADDARELVRIAAVGGRRVPHGMLFDVAEMPATSFDAALRDAIDANVLQLTASGRGYTFRHALLAEAVYDDLLPGERVRLHAAYAAVLAERPERSRAELARHALASHDLETAFTASVAAGDEAMSVAAPQEALQHYETALELHPRDVDQHIALIVSVVDAALAAGHAARGRRLASQALEELAPTTPDEDRAQLLYAVARAAVDSEGELESMETAAEALRILAPEPTLFRVRVAALYSRVNLIRGRAEQAQRWAEEAIEQAEQLGRPGAASEARTTLAMLQRSMGEPEQVAGSLQEIIEQARLDGEVAAEIRSRYNLGSLYYEQGRLAESEQAYETAWLRARELGRAWSLFGADARAMVATLRHQRGDWDGALAVCDVTGEDASGVGTARLSSTALIVRAGRAEAGVIETAESLGDWWPRESLVANSCIQAMLEVHASAGRFDDAAALVDRAVRVLGAAWQEEWFLGRVRFSALVVMAAVTAARERPTERAAALARVAPYVADGRAAAQKGVAIGGHPGIEAQAWSARLEAEWAYVRWLADDDAPTAEEHLATWRAAVDAFGYGNLFETTRSRARLATVLRAAGDTAGASEQADLARTPARAMGAAGVLAELRAIAARPAGAHDAATGLDSLTDREQEVLALLVEARTNRQIAARLYISEKTVSVHVSNILAKLGVRSRGEAAALARA